MSSKMAFASLVFLLWTWRKKLSFHCTRANYKRVSAQILEKWETTYGVDSIDVLTPFVFFTFYPVVV